MGQRNHLYVWDDRFLYSTPMIASDLTRRHTVTLLMSLGDAGFRLGDAAGNWQGYQVALIAHNTARTLDATQAPLLSMNFDPQSYEFHALSALLGRHRVRSVILDGAWVRDAPIAELVRGELDQGSLFRFTTELPRAISGYRPIRMPMDMRVMRIAQKIKQELPLTSTVAELAAQVGISSHRLTHVFSDRLGISIKSYVLWARMRRAVELIAKDVPLAMVAHDVGFSDSAHLTRTLKNFFGLTPSMLARGMEVHMF